MEAVSLLNETMIDSAAARQMTRRQLLAYLHFAFTPELGVEGHDPYFALAQPTTWITKLGFKIFNTDLEYQGRDLDIDDIPTGELEDFRAAFVAPHYAPHPFFSIDHANEWVRLGAFAAYKAYTAPSGSGTTANHFSAASLSATRSSSPASSIHSAYPAQRSSRATSQVSHISHSAASSPPRTAAGSAAVSRAGSTRRSPSHCSTRASSPDPNADELGMLPGPTIPVSQLDRGRAPQRAKAKGKGSGVRRVAPHPSKPNHPSSGGTARIYITRELDVERIIHLTQAPSTWTINDDAVYRLDLTSSPRLFEPSARAKKDISIQRVIRDQDQDAWRASSGGHAAGDGEVYGFYDNVTIGVRAQRVHAHCNGMRMCELVPESLLADCERYEPDAAATLDLWHHQLDANAKEARSVGSMLLRLYSRVSNTKCPMPDCDGVPVMALLPNAPNQYGKLYYIGCSEAQEVIFHEALEHIYIPIPVSVNEDDLKYVMENNGHLPEGMTVEGSDTCVLSLHPSDTMAYCRYGHSVDGQVKVAKVVPRPCDAEMIIFLARSNLDGTPLAPWTQRVALVVARNFHNHPAHPSRKPSLEDEQRVRELISTIGVEGLTVQRLINHPITLAANGGERLAKAMPGFADSRRLQDFIRDAADEKYPQGRGWEGVMHYMATIQPTLEPSEHYVHVAIKMTDFSIVVTMHPQLVMHLHDARYICIDFTFKRIVGEFNEWKIAIFIDRYNMRIGVVTLYCDRNTREAFEQLFIQFFGAVKRVTGRELGLRPWRPDAECRAVILDGEVAQAQGFGDFLLTYNDPSISGITSRDPLELVAYSLKSCQVHFHRRVLSFLLSRHLNLFCRDLSGLELGPPAPMQLDLSLPQLPPPPQTDTEADPEPPSTRRRRADTTNSTSSDKQPAKRPRRTTRQTDRAKGLSYEAMIQTKK